MIVLWNLSVDSWKGIEAILITAKQSERSRIKASSANQMEALDLFAC